MDPGEAAHLAYLYWPAKTPLLALLILLLVLLAKSRLERSRGISIRWVAGILLAQIYNGTRRGVTLALALLVLHVLLALILLAHLPLFALIASAALNLKLGLLIGVLEETWWLHSRLALPLTPLALALSLLPLALAGRRYASVIALDVLVGGTLASGLLTHYIHVAHYLHAALGYLLALYLLVGRGSHWIKPLTPLRDPYKLA